MKSSKCPVFDGSNATHIGVVAAHFLVKEWGAKQCIDYIYEHNVEYWSASGYKRLHDSLPNDLQQNLRSFARLVAEWFGEYPIKQPRLKREYRRGAKTETKVYTVTGEIKLEAVDCGTFIWYKQRELIGSVNVQRKRVDLSPKYPKPDDQRNGAYYLDRQLNHILRRK